MELSNAISININNNYDILYTHPKTEELQNIVDNIVTKKHGAIHYVRGNGLIITDSNISRNTGAELGSGLTIVNTSKPVTLNNVEFAENKAGGGGAIYGWYTNEVSMKNVTFSPVMCRVFSKSMEFGWVLRSVKISGISPKLTAAKKRK